MIRRWPSHVSKTWYNTAVAIMFDRLPGVVRIETGATWVQSLTLDVAEFRLALWDIYTDDTVEYSIVANDHEVLNQVFASLSIGRFEASRRDPRGNEVSGTLAHSSVRTPLEFWTVSEFR